jgi:N-acyl amino acid synthase of PEP-CTERM/exosortase system
LSEGFRRNFEALPAVDDTLRTSVYRIRHAVYCEELGYEPLRSDGLESDEFDARSFHCLLRSVPYGDDVGCVRLVTAGRAGLVLPFEVLCAASIDRSIVDPAQLDRARIAEVSRLAVVSRFRRRQGEQNAPASIAERDFGTPSQPRFPFIVAGLYLGMLAQARRQSIEMLFMLSERSLARQLGRLGVNMRTIGSAIEHRGSRYPSMIRVDEVIDGLNVFVRPLYEVIERQVNAGSHTPHADVTPASSSNPS